jgi:hypothetical protein
MNILDLHRYSSSTELRNLREAWCGSRSEGHLASRREEQQAEIRLKVMR